MKKLKGVLLYILVSIGETILFYIEKYRLLIAIRKANRMHDIYGKRYWVIKLLGKFRVYSTADIKDLRQQKVFSRNLDFIELQKWANYNTNERKRRK